MNEKTLTITKWICGSIISIVAIIMYFSIFPHSIDININTDENTLMMMDRIEELTKNQNKHKVTFFEDCLIYENVSDIIISGSCTNPPISGFIEKTITFTSISNISFVKRSFTNHNDLGFIRNNLNDSKEK